MEVTDVMEYNKCFYFAFLRHGICFCFSSRESITGLMGIQRYPHQVRVSLVCSKKIRCVLILQISTILERGTRVALIPPALLGIL